MIVIVDSGSTKAEWAFVGQNKTLFTSSEGINPATQSEQKFSFDSSFPSELLKDVDKLYFYGAGIKTEESKKLIKNILQNLGIAGQIEAMSDLLGAARACCGNLPGLVAILGTGSNICSYDGKNIFQKSPALGYIMGDEGSGFQIGKSILKSYFYNTMPEDVRILFEKKYGLTLENVLFKIYKKSGNNAYIASFTGFLTETKPEWCRTIVMPIFKDFFESKVLPYIEFKSLPIHFVGSVAYGFQEILFEIIGEYGLLPGNIIQKPLENLVDYHSR